MATCGAHGTIRTLAGAGVLALGLSCIGGGVHTGDTAADGTNAAGAGADSTAGPTIPAPVSYTAHAIVHRLNSTELANSSRDLLGVAADLTGVLPPNDKVNDFDNAVDVPVDATNIQGYMTAAQLNVQAALAGSGRAKLVICKPQVNADVAACAKRIIAPFLYRAFRQPVADADLQTYLAYFDTAANFDTSLSYALQAALISPRFLFRIEKGDGTSMRLTDYEMASRLSYFLWSTTPDSALLQAAEAKALHEPAQIETQVRRMIADARAQAFVQAFVGQWLGVETLDKVQPSTTLYASFDEALRSAMALESFSFFSALMTENLSALNLLKSDFTYVNARLAKHYGIPGVTSTTPQRVSSGTTRGGVLLQAATQAITSTPNRTSIVKRGEWVLLKLMCKRLPPPPPGVPVLPPMDPTKTQREQMLVHQSQPQCASCHTIMDPIGFGLEAYDAVGQLRTADNNGAPLDTSGTLPDGRKFNGALELTTLLQQDTRFPTCFEAKLLTYALGRAPVVDYELAAVETLRDAGAQSHYQMADMIVQLTQSELFQSVRLTKETP